MGMLRVFRNPILQLTQWGYPDQERLGAETADASTGLHSSPVSTIERQAAGSGSSGSVCLFFLFFFFSESRITKIRTTASISKRLLPPKKVTASLEPKPVTPKSIHIFSLARMDCEVCPMILHGSVLF